MNRAVLVIRRTLGLLPGSARRSLLAASLVAVVLALLESLSVALVFPVVSLAVDPTASSRLIDVLRLDGLGGNPQTAVVVLTCLMMGLFIAKGLGTMAYQWWLYGLMGRERALLSTQLLSHYLWTPYTEVSRKTTADMVRGMNDSVFRLFNSVIQPLIDLTTQTLTVVAIFTVLFIASPWTTLSLAAGFLAFSLIYLSVVRPKARQAGETLNEAALQSWRTAFAALGGIKEIQVRDSQQFFVSTYELQARRTGEGARMAGFLNGLAGHLLQMLFIIAIGVVLIFAVAGSEGEPAQLAGLMALYVAAGFRVLPAINGLLGNINTIRVGLPGMRNVEEELSALTPRAGSEHRSAVSVAAQDALVLDDVSFTYPGSDRPAITRLTARLPFGSSTAIVGGSGAGKTTLVDLILALHTPESGTIRADGVDIQDIKGQWREIVAYVPQDVFLRDASVAENVAFDVARQDVDESKLARALELAQLQGVVGDLTEGIDTNIGERGSRLSGGQRQRIGIARALYRGAQLLVLDEATSALDNATENEIASTLRALRGEVTQIIVAHRLSTVRNCDQLLYLEDGRVAASGTFAELIDRSPDFANLVALGSLEVS